MSDAIDRARDAMKMEREEQMARAEAPTKPLTSPPPLFFTGQLVATPAAIEVITRLGISPMSLVERHVRGDWGDLDTHDCQVNQEALRTGGRLMSVYKFGDETVWLITEGNRAATTILLPEDY